MTAPMTNPHLFIKGGAILDLEEDRGETADVHIRDGLIVEIGSALDGGDSPQYDATGRLLSPGWMDMHVHLREPGQEHKETVKTGCDAAAFGGFTAMACMPNTEPTIHTRDVVEFVMDRAKDTVVDVFAIAAVSMDREGKKLTEMADLAEGGAVAFSDDGSPVWDAGLMRTALEYSSMLGRPIINHMEDLTLNPSGHMHEGAASTRLGLPGISGLAEEVMIARDILIAESTGGHVHVAHISTGRAVELVRVGKARGVRVTAEACAHHFTLTDEDLAASNYDTHYKMHPPLRTAADVRAIKEGLRDGTIDAICTDHAPHASFEKEVEFTAAPFGILGLETAWGLTGRELISEGILTTVQAVRCLASEPRRILGLPVPRIAVGEPANLTIFDATTRWVFEARHIKSKSRNTPFVGKEMVGRAWAVYNKGRFVDNAS